MKIEFSHSSIKFFDKMDIKTKSRIKIKLREFIKSIEDYGIIPIKSFDVKLLSGKWYPNKRLRIGKIRIIFNIDYENEKIQILEMDNRGDIY